MRRLLILGSGGAGKSTLARQLGAILDLPVVHLDAHSWKPGWQAVDPAEWPGIVAGLAAGEGWVIDGNYSGTLDVRLATADAVVYLDLPRWFCLYRIVRRRWQYRGGRTRPDMGLGCPERLDWEFVCWVWNYPTRSRPATLARLAALPADKRVVRLRSPGQVRRFLEQLSSREGNRATPIG